MIQIINVIILSIIMLSVFFISFLDFKMNVRQKRYIIVVFTIILTSFLGFRSIGLDLEGYRVIFEEQRIIGISELFSSSIFSSNLEPFFVILISIIKNFGLNFNWFLIISGGIPLLIIYRVIKLSEDKHILIVFLFFILVHFLRGPVDIIRHFFAASLYLSALYSLSQNNKMKFWFKGALSIVIHYSNLVIFLVRPLLLINWTMIKFIITFIFVSIMSFFARFYLVKLSLEDAFVYKNPIIWKFVYYITYYNTIGYKYLGVSHKVLLSLITYFPFVFNIIIILLCLINNKQIANKIFYKLLLNSQIIGVLLAVFFIGINADTLGLRLNFILSIGNFFLIKEVIFYYYNKNKFILFSFVVLILVVYNLLVILYFAGVHNPNSRLYLGI